MNCKQILRDQIHEKYIQGELSVQEKQAYEAHLESCVKCSDGLVQERLLIQGIQSAAKDKMKAEIMRQAEALRPNKKQIDWTVIYKAAAVFLIVALLPGIVYYYNNIEAPQEINARKISNQIQKSTPVQTQESEKIDSILNSADRLGIANASRSLSEEENSIESVLGITKKSEVRPKGHLSKQAGPAAVGSTTKKSGSASRLKKDEQDVFKPESAKPLPVTSKDMKDDQNRVPTELKEQVPVQLSETALLSKQTLVERYSFIPTVVYRKSKAIDKNFRDPSYYRSRDGKIKLKVLIKESNENKLNYQVKSQSGTMLEMNWTFWVPSATISFSELQYEIKQDSLMQLFRRDSLLFELNLNKQQGIAKYFGKK